MQCPGCQCYAKGDTCDICGYVIKQAKPKKKGIKKRSDKRIQVISDDIAFFKEIWSERPHICEVSDVKLGEFNVGYFSHVLTKGAYPAFRHKKENIVLMDLPIHGLWEFSDRSDPRLSWVIDLEQALKEEYYKK
jgi:hypothetical protein